jgi:hypothetical protein
MTPEKTARMALFLAQFRQRFGAGMPDEAPTGAR